MALERYCASYTETATTEIYFNAESPVDAEEFAKTIEYNQMEIGFSEMFNSNTVHSGWHLVDVESTDG